MVVISLLSTFYFLLLFVPSAFAQVGPSWNEIKGEHFVLYVQGGDRTFPDLVLQKAEWSYDVLAGALGYSRRSEFWLWDNRCKIFLYETKEAFHAETSQATWSSGFAIPTKREIVSYQGSERFLDSVLPHEMAHLIFRDFTGTRNGAIPLWLEEGLAMAQEEARREEFERLVQEMIDKGKWLPIRELSKIRSLKDLSTREAALFYAQSQGLVRFLLDSGDSSRFAGFCRDLRDGTALDTALRKNYPKDFPSLEALEKKWVVAPMNSYGGHMFNANPSPLVGEGPSGR